ncbi:hypothetical protein [Flavobacterium sp.]|uniref:hypothetical protein n=1 Tax=Flavobacterium sp. TaxID=239 RepID=UPI00404724D1
MKARIFNDNFFGIYTNDYIEKNKDKIVNGELVSNWQLTEILPNESLIKSIWNNGWIEGATPEEIAEANKPIVPCSISRMRLKLELFERNITVEDIVDTITSIPSAVFSEAEKQKALIKFQEATSYDRYNADLNLIATLMGLSQEDLDEIFINGNL